MLQITESDRGGPLAQNGGSWPLRMQVERGVRVDEFHSLSHCAPYVHPAAAMRLQTLWDTGNCLLSFLDDRHALPPSLSMFLPTSVTCPADVCRCCRSVGIQRSWVFKIAAGTNKASPLAGVLLAGVQAAFINVGAGRGRPCRI